MSPSSAEETTFVDVAIIGAGWYGLSAASIVLKLEPTWTIAIFDKYDTVGGTWSKDRIYPNLVAQVEFGYFNYPSMPMSSAGKPENNLVAGEMIWEYLDKYATDNDLKRHIRLKSWVSKVERNSAGGWILTVNDRPVHAAKVICASGITSQINEPGFPVADDGIPVLHVSEIAKNVKTFEEPQNKHFVLLGAAKSAYDAAYLLTSMGKKVTWVIRDDGSGPMPIMPSKLLGKNTITLGSSRLMNYLSPSLMTTDTWLGAFFHRTALGRFLTRLSWRYITQQSEKAAGFGGNAGPVEGLRPEITDNSCFWCESSLGLITMEDFWSTLRKGDIRIVRDRIASAEAGGVTLQKTGEHVDADCVIYATGWGDHFSFFSPALKEELGIPLHGPGEAPSPSSSSSSSSSSSKPQQTKDGPPDSDPWRAVDDAADRLVADKLPLLAAGPADYDNWQRRASRAPVARRRWRLYNRVVPLSCAGDRSLVVLGQIHTTQTPTIAEVQSLWAVAYLLGEVKLPVAEADMAREVAEWNAWTRRRYAAVGERYPYALFDWIAYLDRLLGDLGVESRRHGNGVRDLFKPYGPAAYQDVVSEYMALRAGRSKAVSEVER